MIWREQRLGQVSILRKLRAVASRDILKQHLRTPLYSNAYYLMASRVATTFLGFVFWVVAARLYPAADVGSAVAIIAVVSLLAELANLGIGYGLIRFLPGSGDKGTAMINSCFTVTGLSATVVALIFLAGLPLWSPALLFVREHPALLIIFVLLTIMWTLSLPVSWIFIGYRTAKFTFLQNATVGIIKIPILLAFTAVFGAFGIFTSAGIAISIGVLLAVLYFLPRIQQGYHPLPTVRKDVMKDIIHYSLGNYVAQLIWVAPSLMFPLMVVNTLGGEMNAYFYMSWAIAAMLYAIPASISLSLIAEGSYEEKHLYLHTRRALKLSLLLLVPAIIIVLGLGDKILLLFGEAYSENGTRLLQILALSALPMIINHLYLSMKRVIMDLRSIIIVSAAITCLALGLSFPLMTNMGIIGIGMSWAIAQTVVAVVITVVLLTKRRARSNIAP